MLPHLKRQAGLPRLEHNRLVAVELGAQEHGVLHLDQCPKFAIVVLQDIVPFRRPLNRCVTPADTDVVGDAHIRVLAPPNADVLLVLSVDDVEDLGRDGRRVDGLEDYIVAGGPLDVDNVDDPVVVRDLEGEHLLAQLAVHLLELDDDLAPMYFDCPLGLEPAFQALQMDAIDSSYAFARGDQRVKIPLLVLLL